MERNLAYECFVCNFTSTKKNHYLRHLRTRKHKKKVIKENDILEKNCDECGQSFTLQTNYYRHKRGRCSGEEDYDPLGYTSFDDIKNQNHNQNLNLNHNLNQNHNLNHNLNSNFNSNLNSNFNSGANILVNPSIDEAKIEKLIQEKEEYLKEIIKVQKESYQKVCNSHQDQIKNLKESQETFKQLAVNNVTQTTNVQLNSNQIIDNSKTIQYLNQNMSDMIDMETFIENYKDTYQLNKEQSRILLESYQLNGIKSYAKCLSKTLKDICEQQMLDRNIEYPNKIAFPLVTTDCNLRSVKIKTINGWETITGDNDLSRIIVISNDQVYRHHRSGIYLPGSAKSTVISFIKKDNSLGKVKNELEC